MFEFYLSLNVGLFLVIKKDMQKSFSKSYVAIITLMLWPKQKEMWNQATNRVANLA